MLQEYISPFLTKPWESIGVQYDVVFSWKQGCLKNDLGFLLPCPSVSLSSFWIELLSFLSTVKEYGESKNKSVPGLVNHMFFLRLTCRKSPNRMLVHGTTQRSTSEPVIASMSGSWLVWAIMSMMTATAIIADNAEPWWRICSFISLLKVDITFVQWCKLNYEIDTWKAQNLSQLSVKSKFQWTDKSKKCTVLLGFSSAFTFHFHSKYVKL